MTRNSCLGAAVEAMVLTTVLVFTFRAVKAADRVVGPRRDKGFLKVTDKSLITGYRRGPSNDAVSWATRYMM